MNIMDKQHIIQAIEELSSELEQDSVITGGVHIQFYSKRSVDVFLRKLLAVIEE